MEGCFAGTTCVSGQCLAEGSTVRTCASSVECPLHQDCILGRCMSNCDIDTDCQEGAICRMAVCRRACTLDGGGCNPDESCSTVDGETGFCIPNSPGGVGPEGELTPFEVIPNALSLSNSQMEPQIVIHNTGATDTTYTVIRRLHRAFDGDGPGERVEMPADLVCENADCPMWWLDWAPLDADGVLEEFTGDAVIEVTVPAGDYRAIRLDSADGSSATRWQGQIEVRHPRNYSATVQLEYSDDLDGQWTGRMVRFSVFEDRDLEGWNRTDYVDNALVNAWVSLKAGSVPLEEFTAILTAIESESWRYANVQELCAVRNSSVPEELGKAACALYSNAVGVTAISTNVRDNPVPAGPSELPVTFHLRPADDGESALHCGGADHCFYGRIQSSDALQFPGNPQVALTLETDASVCQTIGSAGCITPVTSLSADIAVGGRYRLQPGDTCRDGFEQVAVPWLLEGFLEGAERDEETGGFTIYECQATASPWREDTEANRSLAMGNPVPDGRVRYRRLELIDGALINNQRLYLLVKESTESFMREGGPDLVSYGYIILERGPATLSPEEYTATVPARPDDEVDERPPASCSEAILDPLELWPTDFGSGDYADRVVAGILDGVNYIDPNDLSLDDLPIVDEETEFVHWLCVETGLFNGRDADGEEVACPTGSPAIYFTMDEDENWLDGHSCGKRETSDAVGDCHDVLDGWVAGRDHAVRIDPFYTCSESLEPQPDGTYRRTGDVADRNRAFCDDDRFDLRVGKVFYAAGDGEPVYLPLNVAMERAFQYRIRFTSGSGSRVGFVPEICQGSGELRPYCYDPDQIEEIAHRMECAIGVYNDHWDELNVLAQGQLLDALQFHLGYVVETLPTNEEVVHHGFEHLYSELLIMLGDEGYTRALQSRFDLAGLRMSAFEGDRLEPRGVNLSGVAGAEMVSLYQAVQYYDVVLNRFFTLIPDFSESIQRARRSGNADDAFMTSQTVVSYLGRVIRASTQKARVWSEIARRYQNINRPDLARQVIERAYAANVTEAMAISQLLNDMIEVFRIENVDQATRELIDAQRIYRVALMDMRQVYTNIRDELNYFGFAPDYIPFPQIELGRDNAFETAIFRARQRMETARQFEDLAIESDRSFNTDAAAFQNELARIRVNYDDQLSDVCGTFAVEGSVYPAIPRYAALDERARELGDPCGMMGTGRLREAMIGVSVQLTEAQRVGQSMRNLIEEIEIEGQRIADTCEAIHDLADIEWNATTEANNWEQRVDRLRTSIESLDRAVGNLGTVLMVAKCEQGVLGVVPYDTCGKNIATSVKLGLDVALLEVPFAVLDHFIIEAQASVRSTQRGIDEARTLLECEQAEIDSEAQIDTLTLRIPELELEALRAQYQLRQTLATVRQLRNEATRLVAERDELEQLAIDTEAARNNPNIRIYKNDAVLNADIFFYAALSEAYKATRVLEYYTSSSYPEFDKLFLIRMVARGDINLANYLLGLEDYFRAFEDDFGLADPRLSRLSLRDDILRIPLNNPRGEAYSEAERIDMLRERLTDGTLLDENGYVTVPFSTEHSELSPLTGNHKILHVEAEIMGSDLGDPLGRIYLRMAGTATIEQLRGDSVFFRFPQRTAVINTFFNGNRVYADSGIYKNRRLLDRPYLNTQWELILNTVDEDVNEDINLSSITDIRLYIYYTDFTEF